MKWRAEYMWIQHNSSTHLCNFELNIFFVVLASFVEVNTLHRDRNTRARVIIGTVKERMLSTGQAAHPSGSKIIIIRLTTKPVNDMMEHFRVKQRRKRPITNVSRYSQVCCQLSNICSTGKISSAGISNNQPWKIKQHNGIITRQSKIEKHLWSDKQVYH